MILFINPSCVTHDLLKSSNISIWYVFLHTRRHLANAKFPHKVVLCLAITIQRYRINHLQYSNVLYSYIISFIQIDLTLNLHLLILIYSSLLFHVGNNCAYLTQPKLIIWYYNRLLFSRNFLFYLKQDCCSVFAIMLRQMPWTCT